MTALATLEHRFLGHVRGGSTFPRSWCAQGLVDSDIGLSIYTNAYRSRLCEALEADHPVLSRYLGEDLWTEFCRGYIEAHPSRVRSLRHFGASVPDWLAANAPFRAHPLIAELSRFERCLLDAFDAADAPRIDWSAIQRLDPQVWPGLHVRFHPSVGILPTTTNAVEVWRAVKEEQQPPSEGASSVPARLLWRDEEMISRFRPLGDSEWMALGACLVEGRDFSGLCEQLALGHAAGEVPSMAVGFLRRWIDEGVVSAIDP